MKTDKVKLEEYLDNKLIKYALSKDLADEFCSNVEKKHDIPRMRIMNFVTHRISYSEASEFELFCMLEELDERQLSEYFTEAEMQTFPNVKYTETPIITLPIVIKCIQIAPDQYIGGIDTNFLMKLREAQMISYNVNAQRTMQRIVRGKKEFYRISLNKVAVESIKKSFESNIYIPNTITLNMPVSEDVSYVYDKKNCELVINKIKAFDISDGYHRYVAISQIKDADPDWNYPMELRITNFADDKTRNLIFQEDQKTKMRKVDSDSMNMNQSSNVVVERLNQDTMFVLAGNIQRNGGLISFGEISNVINFLYFKTKAEASDAALRIRVQQEIKNGFNALIETDNAFLTHRYTYKDLCIIIYGIHEKKSSEEIIAALARQDELTAKKFYTKTPKKTIFTEISGLF